MADTTFAGVVLRVRRDTQGMLPYPEPVGSPVVRTANLSGGSNVQAVGYRGRAVTLSLEFVTPGEYNALVALIGTSGSLALRPGTQAFIFPNTVLETLSSVRLGRDRVFHAQARFTMDGY